MNIYENDLTEKLYERGCGMVGEGIKKPFKIENFCAQVAWMGKTCPVYPWVHEDTPCDYMVSDEYEGYRCPIGEHKEIAEMIAKKGTPEQKKSMEHLADVTFKFGLSKDDLFEKYGVFLLGENNVSLLWKAGGIYKILGSKDKLAQVNEAIKAKATRDIVYGLVD